MRHRGTLEVYFNLILILRKRQKITWLMYRSNISSGPLRKKVKLLLDEGIIQYNSPFYTLTEKGRKIVDLILPIEKLLGKNLIQIRSYKR